MNNSKKPARREKRKGNFLHIFFMIILSLILIVFLKTGYVLLIIGMLPAIVAYYIDHSISRSLYHSVFACNLSGVLPFIAELIASGMGKAAVGAMLNDPMTLFIIYSSAAAGWILYFTMPRIARGLIQTVNLRKIVQIQATQRRLEQEWGLGIRGDAPPASVTM